MPSSKDFIERAYLSEAKFIELKNKPIFTLKKKFKSADKIRVDSIDTTKSEMFFNVTYMAGNTEDSFQNGMRITEFAKRIKG